MTEHRSLSEFPVRPLRVPGESLGSWCWRIFIANGHVAARAALAASKTARSEPELIAEEWLVSLFGRERLLDLREREGEVLAKWRDSRRPNWHKWAATPRICILCVRVSRCHFMHWDLPLVSACPVHGCRLVDQCGQCKRKLTWTSLQEDWVCICGNPILQGSAPRASATEACLSTVLSLAADAALPLPSGHIPIATLAVDRPYCVRDVYEVLWWFRKMQRALTDWRVYPIPRSWPDISRNDVRLRPGAQEVRMLLGQGSSSVRTQTRYALKGFYRSYPEMFVDLHDLVDDKNLRGLLGELLEESNPLWKPVHEAFSKAVDEHCANFPSRAAILFHPQLSISDRALVVRYLEEWWQRFSARTHRLPGEMRLSAHETAYQGAAHRNPALALGLFNGLVMLALLNCFSHEVDVMAYRWNVPAELKGQNVTAAQIFDYLFGLPEGELAFLLAMAKPALQSWVAAVR